MAKGIVSRHCSAVILLVLILLVVTLEGFAARGAMAHQEQPIDAYLMWRFGCPHCEKAQAYLGQLQQEIADLRVEQLEVSASEINQAIFIAVSTALEIERPAVPLIVVGGRAFVGYLDNSTTGAAVREAVLACRKHTCPDIIGPLLASGPPGGVAANGGGGSEPLVQAPSIPRSVDLPMLGTVSTSALSLPVLTVVLAAVDGFNPCAMWVLVFLIGLLVGLEDHRRMWILGGAFLVASAAVYFIFMAAWLNVLLLLGALLWIRIAIGALALGGGAFYLREFVLSNEAVCKITRPEKRQRIMEGLRSAVRKQRLLLAISGIVVLAVGVNLIELLCSAGIPAVYTQVLSLTSMPDWQYHLYLLLYILVFLLDDLLIFAVAMITLQTTGFTAKYTRYSHLIGGVVLCCVGSLLLLRPEWLAFG